MPEKGPLNGGGDPTQTERTSTFALALTSLPGVVGLLLGGLYAVGAIQVFGQLEAENLKPLDVLPLMPLEQILARGIAFLVLPVGAALAIVSFDCKSPPHPHSGIARRMHPVQSRVRLTFHRTEPSSYCFSWRWLLRS
jgi:hypothetical protein